MAKKSLIERLRIKREFDEAINDINPARSAELFSLAYADDPEFAMTAAKNPMQKLCVKSKWSAVEALYDAGARTPKLAFEAIEKNAPTAFFKKIIDDREKQSHDPVEDIPRRQLWKFHLSDGYDSVKVVHAPEAALAATKDRLFHLEIIVKNLLSHAIHDSAARSISIHDTDDFRSLQDSLAFVETYNKHHYCYQRGPKRGADILAQALKNPQTAVIALAAPIATDSIPDGLEDDPVGNLLSDKPDPEPCADNTLTAFEALLFAKLEAMEQKMSDLRASIPDSPKSLLERLRPSRSNQAYASRLSSNHDKP